MATLAQLRTRVNTFLTNHWPTLVARQENYFQNRGHYWQGLLTHTITPTHTNSVDGDSVADRLRVHPTDQFADWITAFPEWDGVSIPAALKCDVYDGEDGKGYCVTLYIRYNGTLYSRAQNVGPDSTRTYDWRIENEDSLP